MNQAVERGRYTDIHYRQFTDTPVLKIISGVFGILTWPIVLPLAFISHLSDDLFRTISELVSIVPFLFGTVLRYEFYRFALRRCGKNVLIDFGACFIYSDVTVGSNVLIGRYTVVHHCDLGNYVLVSEGCSLLSGARYHNFDRTDIPMALQGGKKTRILIGDDCWIGARSVVMADVGSGSIIGAGSVVITTVNPMSIVAGNPAKLIRKRESVQ